MFILSSQDLTFEASASGQQVLHYLARSFSQQDVYRWQDREFAIHQCFQKLEAGIWCLLVESPENIALWSLSPGPVPVEASQTPVVSAPSVPSPQESQESRIPPAHKLVTQDLLKRYRKGQRDFRDVDLQGIRLEEEQLPDINFGGSNLNESSFKGSNLCRAHLAWSYLREADLRGTNLSEANLSCTYLNWANLTEANLRSAILTEAELRRTRLEKGILTSANLEGTDLREADLTDADLSGANLNGANLKGTILKRANLKGAKVTIRALKAAHLQDTILPDGSLHP